MLNVLGGVAQFEREMMLERQREGIAKAKGDGRYKGRKPTVRAKAAEVKARAGQGLSMSQMLSDSGLAKDQCTGSSRTDHVLRRTCRPQRQSGITKSLSNLRRADWP